MKKSRPQKLSGKTYRIKTGCGKLYITINEHEGKPYEMHPTMGKAGGCATAQLDCIGRLISYSLQNGGQITSIIKMLSGISCHSAIVTDEEKVLSCADAIAKILKQYFEEEYKKEKL
jgi:ribonucleoside-diphosphate reductase alpha chain